MAIPAVGGLSEMPVCECLSGTGLEVALETAGQIAGFEGDVEFDLPGSVSGGGPAAIGTKQLHPSLAQGL